MGISTHMHGGIVRFDERGWERGAVDSRSFSLPTNVEDAGLTNQQPIVPSPPLAHPLRKPGR